MAGLEPAKPEGAWLKAKPLCPFAYIPTTREKKLTGRPDSNRHRPFEGTRGWNPLHYLYATPPENV
jgi:hypothetical protein